MQINLTKIAKGECIDFAAGKGKRKPEIQQLYEEIEACGERLLKYKKCYEILGTDRNSYSKTDIASTFMRMKDDHMMNGQLKPAYKEHIGKHYNMVYMIEDDSHYYRCHDGRNLAYIRTEKHEKNGYTQTMEVYGCSDCSGCEHKAKCLYKYDETKDANKNKVMKINEQWEDLKSESYENIQSEEGILNRQIRSIQTERSFGDIKENTGFRRFNYRSSEKVYKEFMLHAIGRNINKYHRFQHGKIKKFEGKEVLAVA